MRFLLAVVLFVSVPVGLHAQSINGNGNGNGNSGIGSGNGNGNGNGNGSNNTTNSTSNGTTSSNLSVAGSRNTPTIVAPGLTSAGIESCLGSASIGGAATGFGLTIGGTVLDKDCNLRLYSRTLYALGHKTAATQILCNNPEIAQALATEGVRCLVGTTAVAQHVATAQPPVQEAGGCKNYSLLQGCLDRPAAPARSAAVYATHGSGVHPSQKKPGQSWLVLARTPAVLELSGNRAD